ncbi:hypothetical protein [Candidatus Cyanaurora vandensis]|uniref:hypothetical protein n=1 Tax=Candidatus Cyanaurora vandensis TaxID=2714958 RepID=UPI002579CFAD|nr:hypothetical protein [Candidatus Cyanaurora vandensis]
MYRNGLGFRALERVTGVNHHTVILWVKKAATQLPVDPIPESAQVAVSSSYCPRRRASSTTAIANPGKTKELLILL